MSSKPGQSLNLGGLPDPIIIAALDVLSKRIYQGVFESRTEHEARQEFEMWLKPSWVMAENLQLTPETFARWVQIGKWNISNNTGIFALMKDCTALAGQDGWKIPAIGMSVQEAVEKAAEEGVQELIEGLDALIALQIMNDRKP